MPNIRQIRRRIRSVQNTAKITHAMEMIAGAKMRRAQERGLAGRPYSRQIRGVLGHLAAQAQGPDIVHPLMERRPVQRFEIIHITSDRGLCGGLNSNMNRLTASFILQGGVPASAITVGRRGRDFMTRYLREVRADFSFLGDRPSLLDTIPIARVAIEDFTSEFADEVYLAYTQFVNTVVQRPVIEKLLPVEPAEEETQWSLEYLYEPNPATIIEALLPRYVEMEVFHAVLEHMASEQSARMVSMRNATENANDLIKDLTLLSNKVRQETITKELLDIVGGAAVLTE